MAFSYSGELETRILAKAAEDEGFRTQLIDDPKTAISEALGINLPEWVDMQVHQNTATTMHLILPSSGLLAESELEMAAGGQGDEHQDDPFSDYPDR